MTSTAAVVARMRRMWSQVLAYSRFFSTSVDDTLKERSHKFLGDRKLSWTQNLDLSLSKTAMPIYHVLDDDGNHVGDPGKDYLLSDEECVKVMREMIMLRVVDKTLNTQALDGKIAIYAANTGEEACQLGSAAALTSDDMIFAQYRETGVLLHIGYTVQQMMDQCHGNVDDLNRGRQLPVHFGSSALNFFTISTPLTTQLPQAVGAAYSMKLRKKKGMVICYFGEGSASEGDAHAAFNFAATLKCPVLFFCRNNGYAISTSDSEQYAGDGVAGRGHAYGMAALRVDGNDVQAVYNAVMRAKEYILEKNKPVLIEAMTYRGGDHTTLVDSVGYRSAKEIKFWREHDNPLHIWSHYVIRRGLCSEADVEQMWEDAIVIVQEAADAAEKKLKPSLGVMFENTYKHVPPHLSIQSNKLRGHLMEHHAKYPLDEFVDK